MLGFTPRSPPLLRATREGIHLLHRRLQPSRMRAAISSGLGQVVGAGVLVPQPGDVEVVAALGDLSRVNLRNRPSSPWSFRLLCAVRVLAVGLPNSSKCSGSAACACRTAACWSACRRPTPPSCCPCPSFASREEQDVRLDALGVEDAGRQAQDGVQVALVHQVARGSSWPAPSSNSTLSGSTTAARPPGLQAAVDVLEEGELLVAGRDR